ncbi:MAG TPA: aldose 1-epimerase [Caldimonas sp.]|jgi:aldose 1-epimerase|nr:aldose 1-epimerase [Caldimonas sp.]HEX2542507.1 aldose 1-epimerase [Caldimonas sp.]
MTLETATEADRGASSSKFELHAGALRLGLRPDLGGSVAGLWHGETPLLRSTEPARLENAHDSAMFPLLPYSNRLGYRRFRWRGRDYTTRANVDGSPHSLHGIGWQRPWRLVSSSALEVVLELAHPGDADWPFAFTARQYFALSADAFSARLQFTNDDEREQPVGLGFHPYFVKRLRSRLHIELSDRWEADATLLPTRKVAQHGIDSDLSHLDFDNCFEGWRGPARIRDERFSLQLSSSLAYLVVYTPPESDHFCVEPVSHVSNAVHMADPLAHGLAAVPPGATLEAWMKLDVAVL